MLEIELGTGLKLLLTCLGAIRISIIVVIRKLKSVDKIRDKLNHLEGVCEERGRQCKYGFKRKAEDNQ